MTRADQLIEDGIVINKAMAVVNGSAGHAFIAGCSKQNKIGNALSQKQRAILQNVADNHLFSDTLIEAVAAMYTMSNTRVTACINQYNTFGALLKDQADELLSMMARWVQEHQNESKVKLTYQAVATMETHIGKPERDADCDEADRPDIPF